MVSGWFGLRIIVYVRDAWHQVGSADTSPVPMNSHAIAEISLTPPLVKKKVCETPTSFLPEFIFSTLCDLWDLKVKS